MLYPIMEPKRPSAERTLVAPPAEGAAALQLPAADELPPPYVDERLVEAGPRSDFATDTCIRRSGIDPRTGSRYLEDVAFEVVNTQSRAHMVERAEDLTSKGVRRIFAIFVKKREVGEWSPSRASFVPLDLHGTIEDRTLVRPLPVRALFDTAVADDSIVDALMAKGNPRLAARVAEGRAEGMAKILLELLRQRFGPVPNATRARIEAGTSEQLDAWTDRVLTAATLDEVLAP